MPLDNVVIPRTPAVSELILLAIAILNVRADFKPTSVIFAPHQYSDIVLSDIGVALWIGGIAAWAYTRGFSEVFRLYLVPYIWCVSFPLKYLVILC